MAQQTISFPTADGGRIYADLYGKGTRGVVLAHGGRFHKESWRDQAHALVSAGFRVVAIDFRGFGRSSGPGRLISTTRRLRTMCWRRCTI